jgi:hypothetical protein
MFSIDGKTVLTDYMEANDKTISIPALQSGVYFVKLTNNQNDVVVIKKVVKS